MDLHASQPLAGIRAFDAFPKTRSDFRTRSPRGGCLTLLVALVLAALLFSEFRDYLLGHAHFSFAVDSSLARQLDINLDLTVAMPCHYLSVDLRDAVGDRMHVVDQLRKHGTRFHVGLARRIDTHPSPNPELSASKMVLDAQKSSASFSLFSHLFSPSNPRLQFPPTRPLIPDGPACRIFGNLDAKKVAGNLHITTLGHGYLSWEHTDHKLMNLSHVISEFSFGKFFPSIVQPLDNSAEITSQPFHISQYFISVVPTTYIDRAGHRLRTNQYSVTDMSRATEHGLGVPGIFFKFDIEPMSLTVQERTTSLVEFLVRLCGMIGGIVVCTGWSFRLVDRIALKVFPKMMKRSTMMDDDSVDGRDVFGYDGRPADGQGMVEEGQNSQVVFSLKKKNRGNGLVGGIRQSGYL